jgi:AraC-like DNA-binding protein
LVQSFADWSGRAWEYCSIEAKRFLGSSVHSKNANRFEKCDVPSRREEFLGHEPRLNMDEKLNVRQGITLRISASGHATVPWLVAVPVVWTRPPLAYVRKWRLTLARAALMRGDAAVASIANRVGYTSQSAFGHAFRRAFGTSPKANFRSEDQQLSRQGNLAPGIPVPTNSR